MMCTPRAEGEQYSPREGQGRLSSIANDVRVGTFFCLGCDLQCTRYTMCTPRAEGEQYSPREGQGRLSSIANDVRVGTFFCLGCDLQCTRYTMCTPRAEGEQYSPREGQGRLSSIASTYTYDLTHRDTRFLELSADKSLRLQDSRSR